MDETNLTSDQVQEIGNKVVKKKRAPRPEQTVQTEPGDNARYLRHSLMIARLPKVDLTDANAVRERVFQYFDLCEQNDMKPHVAGLALALGISRQQLWNIRTGVNGKNPDVLDTLKRACELLDAQMSDYMQNGKINPVAGIFLMKNNFGYTDKQEVIVTPSIPLGDQSDDKSLQERYTDAVVVDDYDDITQSENGTK